MLLENKLCTKTNVTSVSSLKNLQDRTANVNTDEDPSGWRPYLTFVDNLREKSLKYEGWFAFLMLLNNDLI